MSITFQLLSFTSILTCFFFLLVLVAYWKRNKARGTILKSPPGLWKLPLIGNLHQLITSGSLPHSSLRDLAKKHGPVMRLQLGEVSAVIISSPKAAREVLKTHELCLHKGLTFLLSINLSKNLFAMTNTVTSRAAFGEKCKGQDEFITLVKEIMVLCSGFNVPDLYPSLKFIASINGMKTALKILHQKRDSILQDIIDDHKMNMITTSTTNDSSCKEDLVDVLLKLQKSSDLKFEITTKHIKAVTSEIYLAGGEAAATTLEWAMSELLRNPKVMEKAQAEVRKPERFHDSSVDFKGNDFEFLPFGAGRRMRPGISFGIAIVELELAQLLYHFDWKLPNEVKPEELDMTENFGSTCRRKNDLYLNVTPRFPFLMETCSQ
ncbi:hypothetical protein SO802_000167 [Lithocarpus litseifolius]|uniref:Cytochrome P450 n=1 Tax=Lithocarpus litseifolius TaxID=425828 RepID=A0AAW2DR83_9ROSI